MSDKDIDYDDDEDDDDDGSGDGKPKIYCAQPMVTLLQNSRTFVLAVSRQGGGT